MDTTEKLTHLSLCAGYGGIDLGLQQAGFDFEFTVYVEVEAFAAFNLAKKIESESLGQGVIWPDLKTFPFRKFRGGFDILSGGFPCQPFSQAGKGKGDEDPRHLFPYILEGIQECQPSLVVLENVEGIVSAKLKGDHWRDPAGTPVLLHVLRELERVGYRATAVPSSASEVGAPHQRNRWFIIGVADGGGEGCEGVERGGAAGNERPPSGHPPKCCGNVADGNGSGSGEDILLSKLRAIGIEQSPGGERVQLRQGEKREIPCWPARPGQEQFGWEPPRVVGKSPSAGLPERAPRAMGECQGKEPESKRPAENCEREAKPSLGRNFDESAGGMGHAELCESCDNRTDELRLLGNGVVPASCADAVRRGLRELLADPSSL